MNINWALGDISIAGNEEADRLAKEDAHEASTFKGSGSTYMADVKLVRHTHMMTLWQRRWSIAEVGREFFKYSPYSDSSNNRRNKYTAGYCNYKLDIMSSTSTDSS